ncbi:MAG TPA: hypothetical protein GX745_01015 [Clostridiales bacterium]|jgi:hypothetical protein|nr:hypothetical protein [Clostridiales bacterium]
MKFLSKDWEMFYTTSKADKDKLVDQISIDKINKRYILDTDVREVLSGSEESHELIFSCFVSRLVFDCILEGLKKRGFVEYAIKAEQDEKINDKP